MSDGYRTCLPHYFKIAMEEVAWATKAPRGHHSCMLPNVPRIHAQVMTTNETHWSTTRMPQQQEHKQLTQGKEHSVPASNVTIPTATTEMQRRYMRNHQARPKHVRDPATKLAQQGTPTQGPTNRLKEEPKQKRQKGDGALATSNGAKAGESETLVGKTTCTPQWTKPGICIHYANS